MIFKSSHNTMVSKTFIVIAPKNIHTYKHTFNKCLHNYATQNHQQVPNTLCCISQQICQVHSTQCRSIMQLMLRTYYLLMCLRGCSMLLFYFYIFFFIIIFSCFFFITNILLTIWAAQILNTAYYCAAYRWF